LLNAKCEYAKIVRKILLENALWMIFIDFGLLRSPYCKIYYLLADIKIRVKIWQPTYDSVCEDNSRIHGKCRQRFYQTFTNVFLLNFFPRFLRFNVLFIYIWTFINDYDIQQAACTDVSTALRSSRSAIYNVPAVTLSEQLTVNSLWLASAVSVTVTLTTPTFTAGLNSASYSSAAEEYAARPHCQSLLYLTTSAGWTLDRQIMGNFPLLTHAVHAMQRAKHNHFDTGYIVRTIKLDARCSTQTYHRPKQPN